MSTKYEVIHEVEPIIDLLEEIKIKLDAIPRSTTASRQLNVQINKLRAWYVAFQPSTDTQAPTLSKDEVVAAAIQWFEHTYHPTGKSNGHAL